MGSSGFPFPWALDPQFGSELTQGEAVLLTLCPGLAGWPTSALVVGRHHAQFCCPVWERELEGATAQAQKGRQLGAQLLRPIPAGGQDWPALEPHLLKGARRHSALNKPSLKSLLWILPAHHCP